LKFFETKACDFEFAAVEDESSKSEEQTTLGHYNYREKKI
jgi:hypothetical protein